MSAARRANDAQDAQPLLADDAAGEPDVRFAIDDEYALADELDADGAPKYPPSVPPPAYGSLGLAPPPPGGRIAAWLRAHDIDLPQPDWDAPRRAWRRLYAAVWRHMPSSRIAVAGCALAAMWLLILTTAPSVDMAPQDDGGWWAGIGDVEIDEDLSPLPAAPEPVSGDGHIVEAAQWATPHCAVLAFGGRRPFCRTSVAFNLTSPQAFDTDASLFLFADPLRAAGLSDGRGRVPGAVRVRRGEQGTPPSVRIEARYERGRAQLLREARVGKMKKGIQSEGVGIYTNPLPDRLASRLPPPLSFDIEVTLPALSRLPAFVLESAAMDFFLFAPLPPSDPRAIIFADALELEAGLRAAPGREPLFGRFEARAGDGSVVLGAPGVQSIGYALLRATSGDVVVRGPLRGPVIDIHTDNGAVRVAEGGEIAAWKRASLDSDNGAITIEKGGLVGAPELHATTGNGEISGAGMWQANGTMQLKSSNGAVSALVAPITASPAATLDFSAQSKNGAVSLRLLDFALPLAVRAAARTELGSATLHLPRNYTGAWAIHGSRGSTDVHPPPPTAAGAPVRKWSSEGRQETNTHVSERGRIWLEGQPADGEATVDSGQGGAHLFVA